MNPPRAVLEALERTREETLRRLALLDQSQLDWRPEAVNGREVWSPGEVFMHLALDELYLRELIARPLLENVHPPDGVRFIPPPPPAGTLKEVILFWFDRARLETRRLLEDWPPGADLDASHHGGLRPMNGLEWLEAYASHEAFHHTQLDELIEMLPARPADQAVGRLS